MRILVLLPEAFGGRGGIAQYDRDFLNVLCEHENVNEVIALPRYIKDDFIQEDLPAKLKYKTIFSGSKFNYIKKLFQLLLHDRNYDLVICAHLNLMTMAYIASFLCRARLSLLGYGIEIWQPTKSFFNNFCSKKIDYFLSISRITRDRFYKWAGEKPYYYLPNAIDLSRYNVSAKNKVLVHHYALEGQKVLLTCGRMNSSERYKGFDEILDILPDLLEKNNNMKYMIVGEGDDKDRLENKVKQLSLQNHVIFAGYVSEEEKTDYYRLADVFVMPGRGEGFGFVYLEALACGVPVIGSKLDGSREALRSGKLGLLVDPNNLSELKQSIQSALTHPLHYNKLDLEYFSMKNFKTRLFVFLDKVHNDLRG